jgi:hypothetical protein
MQKGTHVADACLLEHRSAEISGPPEMVHRSRRREATPPDATCLGRTWKPKWGLPLAADAPQGGAEAPVGQDGQEANADNRKVRGRHNLSDHALPTPKGG